jgi:hypothetical protein
VIEDEEVPGFRRLQVTHFELNEGSEDKHTYVLRHRAKWFGKMIEVGGLISITFGWTAFGRWPKPQARTPSEVDFARESPSHGEAS